MVASVEILISQLESRTGKVILKAMHQQAPIPVQVGHVYAGRCDGLMLWGVGRSGHGAARDAQLARGGHAYLWDMGYFGRRKREGYLRVSIDHQHPQQWLDLTSSDPSRWDEHGIALREDFTPKGHVVLVGMGPKSHAFLKTQGWEQAKLAELRRRFPGRRIVFRPKPGRPHPEIACEVNATDSIERVLKGASLVVCRHSNVAIDACIAGIPFECEDGAASWIQGKPYTQATRLDLLRRLAWWQWKPEETAQAWKFLLGITAQ